MHDSRFRITAEEATAMIDVQAIQKHLLELSPSSSPRDSLVMAASEATSRFSPFSMLSLHSALRTFVSAATPVDVFAFLHRV